MGTPTVAPTTWANLEAATETASGSTSEATPGRGNGRDDRRLIISSKQQLQTFMTDSPKASLESLNID